MKSLGRFGSILLLLLVILLVLYAIALHNGSPVMDLTNVDTKRTVVLIGKLHHGDYWQNVEMGALAAAKEFNVNLEYQAPENTESVSEQNRLLEQSYNKGVNAVVIGASDAAAESSEIDKIAKQGTPVIAIDSEVSSTEVLSFIGTNNVEAGKMAGGKMIELTNRNAKIGIISSEAGKGNDEAKEKGLREAFQLYPNSNVVDIQYSHSDPKLAAELTKSMIENHKKLDGIVVLDVNSSVGVADEIKKLKLDGKVKLITFDSSQELLSLLQDGVIQATVIQNPFRMGYMSVKYAVDAMDHIEIPKNLKMDSKLIDIENMFWPENEKLLFPFVY